MRLYWCYLVASMRSQMQYRASFVAFSVAQFVGIGVEFLGVWALLDRFGAVRGWRLDELALLFGMVNIAFALAEGFGRGFDTFASAVKRGEFDRLLVRPRATALQVAGREFQLLRVGRLLLGMALTVWAALTLHVRWSAARLLLLLGGVVGGACVFLGLFVLQATLCFWTIESLEIMNALTYGGTEAAQYPLDLYRPWFRRFFTFLVPLGFVSYLPVGVLLGRPTVPSLPPALRWCSPLIGVAFLGLTLLVWRVGERRYTSTGS
jgi:ABC-2 type transport system permease protein